MVDELDSFMTPIERVSEKSHALSVLGLSNHCTTDDLRAAFRQRAKETHPDQSMGNAEDFAEVSTAYQFLKDHAEELGIFDRPKLRTRTVSRPTIQRNETVFSDDIIAECEAILDDNTDTTQLVASQMHRVGRNVTYHIPGTPTKDANTVVVPTGELVDNRHAYPVALRIDARDISSCTYRVPQDICADMFPGARSVQIRFASS